MVVAVVVHSGKGSGGRDWVAVLVARAVPRALARVAARAVVAGSSLF